ncbi:MAG: FecR domain-containing protein [Myxococcales bacterium]|nr:FecR domain-containing protein [Myxococcales bacterium]
MLCGCPEGGAGADALPPRQPAAHLEQALGVVLLERGGSKGPALLGYLYVDDSLETGADGEAQVRFPGGRLVELGPDARFAIATDATGLVLKVERGLLLSRVPADASGASEEAPVALTIETPFGLTRVGKGQSEVSIEVGKDQAKVQVRVGEVEFLSRNGQAISAAAGEMVAATSGAAELSRQEGRQLTLEPLSVTVYASGRAEVRRKDSKAWRPLGKKGQPLGEGDALRVLAGRSVLALDGSRSRLTFARGTEIVFDRSGKKDGVEQASLALSKGELSAALSPGKRSRLAVGDFELVSDLGGQLVVVKTADGFEVTAVTGDFLLLRGEAQKKLAAGRFAHVPKSGSPGEAKAVSREEIALPSRVGLKVFHANVGRGALTWEGGEGDYRVEVASDSSFSELLLAGVVHKRWVNVSLPPHGALHWRVFEAASGREVDKGSATFSAEPASRELSRLRNEVADGSDKTTIFFQDKPPAVTFTFKPEAEAARYRLLVYREDALDRPMAEREVREPRAPLEAGVLAEGRYVWSVTPLSSKGEELRGGKMNKLEITYDNAVPNLIIRSPKNGEWVRGGTVPVSGVAPVGARVFVNGRAVPLDEKARFDSTAAPFGRPPVVVFRMSPSFGPEVFTVRSLRRGK